MSTWIYRRSCQRPHPHLAEKRGPRRAVHTLSTIAATPKPRLVKLEIMRIGEDRLREWPFFLQGFAFSPVKVNLGEVTGAVAPLVARCRPDKPCVDTRRCCASVPEFGKIPKCLCRGSVVADSS
jgi:hypothetical protein